MCLRKTLLAGLSASMLVACGAQQAASPPGAAGGAATDPARPAPNPLRNAYFGDLHLHTRNSFDAYIFNVRASPDEAYAYAKGGTIKHATGFDMKLNSGPLDFLAVTDHSEYLGVLPAIDTPGDPYASVPYAQGPVLDRSGAGEHRLPQVRRRAARPASACRNSPTCAP